MKEKWVVSAKKADFQAIGQRFGIDPVLARIMRNRGLTDLQEMNLYLHGTRADLNDPHLLKDADLAAQILREKIKEKKRNGSGSLEIMILTESNPPTFCTVP